MTFELRDVGPEDQAAIEALLASCGLPTAGVGYAYPHGYVVALAGNRSPVPSAGGDAIVGCAGVEFYGADGLMRSVAVAPGQRGCGLGARLVADRIAFAQKLAVSSLYLLTTTASEFFEHIGFQHVQRAAVPVGIRASAEFASICPESAIVLKRSLG